MEPQSPKKHLMWGAVSVVILVVIIVISMSHKTQAPTGTSLESNASSTENVDGANNASSTASTTATNTGTTQPVVKTMTYTQAVNAYKDRRIQFDASCGVIPLQLNAKNKTTIMLDNRASQARTVYLDRVAYNLGALGYKLVTLSYATSALPHTVTLDCGTGRNSAKILVQK